MITADPSTWPSGDLIWTVAQAIAHQEGYDISGSAPNRYNNPGDLSPGDEHGQSVSGYITLSTGAKLIIFTTPEAGWNALYTKLANILNGSSSVYSANWSWGQIGQTWANDPNWGIGVAAFLGVSPNSVFGNYFSSQAANTVINPGAPQIIFPGDPSVTQSESSDPAGGQISTPLVLLFLGLGLYLFLEE